MILTIAKICEGCWGVGRWKRQKLVLFDFASTLETALLWAKELRVRHEIITDTDGVMLVLLSNHVVG